MSRYRRNLRPLSPAWRSSRVGTPLALASSTGVVTGNAVTSQPVQVTQAAGRLVFHAGGVTAQVVSSATAAGHLEHHAGGVTAQIVQGTQGAGRLEHHAGGVTAQPPQVTEAAGRLEHHAGGVTAQPPQVTEAAGHLEHHAGGVTAQVVQGSEAAGHLEHHAGGVTAQAGQSSAAAGRLEHRAAGLTQQAMQAMSAAGQVSTPVMPSMSEPGWRAIRVQDERERSEPERPPHIRGVAATAQRRKQFTQALGKSSPPITPARLGAAATARPVAVLLEATPVALVPAPAQTAAPQVEMAVESARLTEGRVDQRAETDDEDLAIVLAIAA